MIRLLQRAFGLAAVAAGVLLLSFSFMLPAGTPDEPPRNDQLRFLPEKHETVSVGVGGYEVSPSPSQAFSLALASSVLLIASGSLLLWRGKLSGNRNG